MKKTRILFDCSAPLVGGGAVVSLYRLLSRLDRDRYEPIILVHEFSGNEAYLPKFVELGIEVIWLRKIEAGQLSSREQRAKNKYGKGKLGQCLSAVKRALPPLRAAHEAYKIRQRYAGEELPRSREIERLLREREIDLLYLNDSFRNHRGDILAARRAGVPSLCHTRVFDEIQPYDRKTLRQVDYFVHMSTAIENHIQQHWPQASGQVVYDGLDLDEYRKEYDVAGIRAQYGLAPDDFVIGNVGRLVQWKGQDVFIRALGKVARQAPDLKGLIVGCPDSGHERFLDELKALAKSEGVENRVVFAGFCLEVAPVLAAMDVNVHSSSKPEPFGIVVIEALASGKPIIATRAGGPLDSVKDNVDGLLVPLEDPDAMAAALLDLYQNRDKVAAMGAAGQAKAAEMFGVDRYAEEMQGVFDALLARSAAAVTA